MIKSAIALLLWCTLQVLALPGQSPIVSSSDPASTRIEQSADALIEQFGALGLAQRWDALPGAAAYYSTNEAAIMAHEAGPSRTTERNSETVKHQNTEDDQVRNLNEKAIAASHPPRGLLRSRPSLHRSGARDRQNSVQQAYRRAYKLVPRGPLCKHQYLSVVCRRCYRHKSAPPPEKDCDMPDVSATLPQEKGEEEGNKEANAMKEANNQMEEKEQPKLENWHGVYPPKEWPFMVLR